MEAPKIAKVYVSSTTICFDKAFDYLLPSDIAAAAQIGARVLVPFGRSNKKRLGIIYDIMPAASSDLSVIKPISQIIDKQSLISDEMIKLAEFISERCFCTFYDAVKPMLPPGINVNIVSVYKAANLSRGIDLSPEQRRIYECVANSENGVRRERICEIFGIDENSELLSDMVAKGALFDFDDTVRKVGDASVKMAQLCEFESDDEFESACKTLTKKQKSVVEFLIETQSASLKEICYFTGVTTAVITALVKKGIVQLYENEVYRSPYATYGEGERNKINLSAEQQTAYDGLKNLSDSCKNDKKGAAALLYGVTGSGKTQVFLRLIDDVIDSGRGVIVMVPEIALTPQTMSIFQRRYGARVAIFHSAMSLGQRNDAFKRVMRGEAQIAIGTRSAIFAPFRNLGLIIMDEEQEHTYKSESTPRYSAKDAAKFRCMYNNCLFLMASATPSIETFSAAKAGKIPMFTMKKRYGDVHLPKVRTVNMKDQYMKGNFGIFSDELCNSLSAVLNEGMQSILLLNRRGYNVFVSCRNCGEVKTCPNCSISLTYHSANNRLMCHYCGYSEDFAANCPKCGGKQLKLSGFGTQKAEEELQLIFPKARILRMDADTTMTRFSHEKKLTAFANGEYDIMIGTQMVAKGLDFPNVILVGVINADQSLFATDFRSAERSFSLFTQVIGRSGRGKNEGEAIIQTITPENEIIWQSAKQDYDAFFETEIGARRLLKYPPFCNICVVGFVGEDRESVDECAKYFFDRLKTALCGDYSDQRMIVLGPSVAGVPKIGGKYRYRIILKCKNSSRFRSLIRELLCSVMNIRKYKNVSIFADIDPESIM